MKIFRPILSLILVLATTILVSCSGPNASAPPSYDATRLQKISVYRIPVDTAQTRLAELGKFVSEEDWTNTKAFTHGPLGLIRRDMTYLSKALVPNDQDQALEIAKDIFEHLGNLDTATQEKNYQTATSEYEQLVSDFDVYLDYVAEKAG